MAPLLPIGTIVLHNGRAYRFCGITPASIQPTMASLEDLRTGALSDVPADQLDPDTITWGQDSQLESFGPA